MAKKKKKSTFQKVTIVMAFLMAIITLLGIVVGALSGAGLLNF